MTAEQVRGAGPPAAAATRPRIGFFGTPDFAVAVLAKLVAAQQFEVVFVVSETDKPSGRGHRVQATPVKRFAESVGLPVLQPESLRGIRIAPNTFPHQLVSRRQENLAFVEALNRLAPFDAFVSAAYGKLLPSALLACPRFGILNVHASLLPRWRGAAPVHRALFHGDKETGVCIMQTEKELDTGPVFAQAVTEITAQDTLQSLHDRLATIGAELLVESLPRIISRSLTSTPQLQSGITYAEKWLPPDREINWAEPAEVTVRRIRTCNPAPGARTALAGQQIKVLAAHQIADQHFPQAQPGQVVEVNRGELVVAAGENEFISIDVLQFPGKTPLPIKSVLTGRPIAKGEQFS